jgi:hypothetical protein
MSQRIKKMAIMIDALCTDISNRELEVEEEFLGEQAWSKRRTERDIERERRERM